MFRQLCRLDQSCFRDGQAAAATTDMHHGAIACMWLTNQSTHTHVLLLFLLLLLAAGWGVWAAEGAAHVAGGAAGG